jgi:hypothetical protein
MAENPLGKAKLCLRLPELLVALLANGAARCFKFPPSHKEEGYQTVQEETPDAYLLKGLSAGITSFVTYVSLFRLPYPLYLSY